MIALSAMSIRRRARSGKFRVDVLMMILTLLATIGAGGAVVMVWDPYSKDEVWIRKMETVAQMHEAEWATVQEVAARAGEPLGFRLKEGGLPNHESIEDLITKSTQVNPVVCRITDAARAGETDRGGGLKINERDERDWAPGTAVKIDGIERKKLNEEGGFSRGGQSIKTLIAYQDAKINEIVTTILPAYGKVRRKERDETIAEEKARGEAQARKVTDWNGKVEDADRELKTKGAGQDTNENAAAMSVGAAEKALTEADDAVRAAAIEVDKGLLTIKEPRNTASEKHDRAVEALARRVRAEADDANFHGKILQVDPVSGWVWINMGQPDNIKTEMSFGVFRPTPNVSGFHRVAELQVKMILPGRMSRCRITSLQDSDVLPHAGDLIKHELYSDEQYQIYSFLGNFGGGATKYSRQQLSDLLWRFNKIVQAQPEDTVECIILGDAWEKDPLFTALVEKGVKFETMKEEEVLYMFGVAGPDPFR